MPDTLKNVPPIDLEIESFAALSKDQVDSIMRSEQAATERSSVNWEFTEIAECCCGYTEIESPS